MKKRNDETIRKIFHALAVFHDNVIIQCLLCSNKLSNKIRENCKKNNENVTETC